MDMGDHASPLRDPAAADLWIKIRAGPQAGEMGVDGFPVSISLLIKLLIRASSSDSLNGFEEAQDLDPKCHKSN